MHAHHHEKLQVCFLDNHVFSFHVLSHDTDLSRKPRHCHHANQFIQQNQHCRNYIVEVSGSCHPCVLKSVSGVHVLPNSQLQHNERHHTHSSIHTRQDQTHSTKTSQHAIKFDAMGSFHKNTSPIRYPAQQKRHQSQTPYHRGQPTNEIIVQRIRSAHILATLGVVNWSSTIPTLKQIPIQH